MYNKFYLKYNISCIHKSYIFAQQIISKLYIPEFENTGNLIGFHNTASRNAFKPQRLINGPH